LSVKISKTAIGIKFSVRVVPKSSKNQLLLMDEGIIKVKITAPPVEGKANECCIAYLASILGVTKSQVSISSGEKSKTKVFEVTGNPDTLSANLVKAIKKA